MSLYRSDWNPRGVRSAHERTSVSNEDAQSLFGAWCKGIVTDACAWVDQEDRLKILVADTDSGHRMTLRVTARGHSITTDYRGVEADK